MYNSLKINQKTMKNGVKYHEKNIKKTSTTFDVKKWVWGVPEPWPPDGHQMAGENLGGPF